MKALIGCAAIFFALATVQSVEAKGCLKGAAVGGAPAGSVSGCASPISFDPDGKDQIAASRRLAFDQGHNRRGSMCLFGGCRSMLPEFFPV
jgi:hypothetical protein